MPNTAELSNFLKWWLKTREAVCSGDHRNLLAAYVTVAEARKWTEILERES